MTTKDFNDCAGARGSGPASHPAPSSLHLPAALHGTILIADDEEHIVAFVARALRRLGLHVMSAGNGARAVELFSQYHREIDCVLLDFLMPQLGGEDVLRHIRIPRPDIPAVIMSGSIEQEVRARFARWRGVSILHKPFGLDALEEHIRAALGRRRDARS